MLLALAFTAGCSSDPPPPANVDAAVRPFEDVQASPFEFEADPTNPQRGIFGVTTSEPMICAIVWGETDALGRFNNSLSMNGTGITDHDVYLPDAIAGRTYHYVVQGTTADGTLYRSDLATFTIPRNSRPTTPTSTPSQNLALDANVIDVSSEFSDSYAATNAIDGAGTTEWSSAGDGNDAFITLELVEAAPIGTVAFITRSMLDGTATTHTYTVTLDGGTTLGPFPAGTPADPTPSNIDATARTLRFDVDTSTSGNVGAVEIQVFAP